MMCLLYDNKYQYLSTENLLIYSLMNRIQIPSANAIIRIHSPTSSSRSRFIQQHSSPKIHQKWSPPVRFPPMKNPSIQPFHQNKQIDININFKVNNDEVPRISKNQQILKNNQIRVFSPQFRPQSLPAREQFLVKSPQQNKKQFQPKIQQYKVYCVLCDQHYSQDERVEHVKKHQRSSSCKKDDKRFSLSKNYQKQEKPQFKPIVQPSQYFIDYNPLEKALSQKTEEESRKTSRIKDQDYGEYELIKVDKQQPITPIKQILQTNTPETKQIEEVEKFTLKKRQRNFNFTRKSEKRKKNQRKIKKIPQIKEEQEEYTNNSGKCQSSEDNYHEEEFRSAFRREQPLKKKRLSRVQW